MKDMKKILVVGYGSIGKRHVNNLLSYSSAKIIICTKQKDIWFLKRKGINIYNSLDRCLEENPDIGFVANETSFHIPIAIKLAKAGLDLFLEKPLSDSMRGVKTLVNLIKRKKLITQMGCNWRFHPCIKKIKQLISQNAIGRIISVHVENGSYLPDWHPSEDYRLGYAARKDLGGGIVLTQIHELDYLYWFFGDIKEVFSVTGKFSDLEIMTDDLSSNILRFKNNVISELHLDYFQRPDFKSCKIKGTKGVLYWNSQTNEVKLYNMKKKMWLVKMKVKNYQTNSMYIDEIKHFLKCVDKRKETINNIEQGVKTLETSLAIKKSSKLKRMIKP